MNLNDLTIGQARELVALFDRTRAFAREIRHLMKDSRSLAALDVAERFIEGLASSEELAPATATATATATAPAPAPAPAETKAPATAPAPAPAETKAPPSPQVHPFVGMYVICRCVNSGVHAGVLLSQEGQAAVLKDSRRLWSWTANGGVALSGLAIKGLKDGKVDTCLPLLALSDVCETIPTSALAEGSIRDFS